MMNTVRKSENLLPFPVISAAANGDTTAMCAILKHYEGYIAKLCTRTLKDDAGNTYSYVDEEMRNRLQVRLITRTLNPFLPCILTNTYSTEHDNIKYFKGYALTSEAVISTIPARNLSPSA